MFLSQNQLFMTIFWKTILLFCLLSSGFPALYAAPDTAKTTAYIFRWGKNVKTLERKNKFKATIYLTPEQFRRTLWAVPNMEKLTEIEISKSEWRSQLEKVPVLVCKIDGIPFEFRRDEPGENKMAFQLERQFLPCGPGQTYRMTDIPLDNGRKGQVDFVIQAPRTGIEQATVREPLGPLTIVDPTVLSFQWGPHIDLQLDRDFLTVKEFWETVAAQPEATVPEKAEVRHIKMNLQFFIFNQIPLTDYRSVFAYSDQEQNASQTLQKGLDTLREKIKPGVLVETEIDLYTNGKQFSQSKFSTQSSDPKVQVRFWIVADDDPRLALRRSRDAHQVRIRLGDREERYPSLYLRQYVTSTGDTVHADPALDMNWFQSTPEFAKTIRSWPRIWVDDREIEVKSLSFGAKEADSSIIALNAYLEKRRRMTSIDSLIQFVKKQYTQLPRYTRAAWSAKTIFAPRALAQPSILYYSVINLEAEEYDLSRIQLRITRPDTTQKFLMDRNTYAEYEAMPLDPRIQLMGIPDTISKKVWAATPVESRPKPYFTIAEADYVFVGSSCLNVKGEGCSGSGGSNHARTPAGARHFIELEQILMKSTCKPSMCLVFVQSARGIARKRVVMTD
jgi:hypothetical protein